MRLTRIEIENFKGIGKRQVIDLKPITLLFGPNSAGKSTILQALHYLREILERQNADPDQTIAGGLIDLGGFATLVHDHDLSRAIKIKVELDIDDGQESDLFCLNNDSDVNAGDLSHLPIRYLQNTEETDTTDNSVQSIALMVEVKWSASLSGPYVSQLAIDINGQPLAAILSPPQAGRALLSNFEFKHPLLKRIVDDVDQEIADTFDNPELNPTLELSPEEIEELESDPFSSPLGEEIWELSREVAAIKNLPEANNPEFSIAVETEFGALPGINNPLIIDLLDVDRQEIEDHFKAGNTIPRLTEKAKFEVNLVVRSEQNRRRSLRTLLDEIILDPVRTVRDYLCEMTYIGPLREIPSRSFRPRLSPDEARWAHGLAAWDLLYTDTTGKLQGEVNDWLSNEQRLKTGYRLEKIEFKEIPVPSRFAQLFDREISEDDIGELQELYRNLKSRSEIALRDFEKGILVAPSDVGVGISQMVPVVVACLRPQDGILAIEQPELHVHPAIQVGMGDLFIQAVQPDENRITSGKTLLIETHSEHIILRLLRRIREKTDDELPPAVLGIESDDISVVYVEAGSNGTNFRQLRVDEDGEFIDRWPKGFFEERAEELF